VEQLKICGGFAFVQPPAPSNGVSRANPVCDLLPAKFQEGWRGRPPRKAGRLCRRGFPGERSGEDGIYWLLRFHPGGRVPLHEHAGYEHIFVLSGEQVDEVSKAETGDTDDQSARHAP
jgi:hypothetical protein